MDPTRNMKKLKQFLVTEVINQLNTDTRNFILETAFLDHLIPEEIDQFLGVSNSYKLLEKLHNQFSYLSKSEDGAEFHYHELFQSSALELYRMEKSPAGLYARYRSFARYLISREDWIRGLRFLLMGGETKTALETAERLTAESRDAQVDNIGRLFKDFPISELSEYPGILLELSKYLILQNDFKQAEIVLDTLIAACRSVGDKKRLLRGYQIKLTSFVLQIRYDEWLKLLKEAVQSAGDYCDVTRIHLEMELICNGTDPDKFEKVYALYERALDLPDIKHNSVLRAKLELEMVYRYFDPLGRFDEGIDLLLGIKPIFERNAQFMALIQCFYMLAILSLHKKEFKESEVFAEQLLNLAARYNRKDRIITATGILGFLEAHNMDFKKARARIDELNVYVRDEKVGNLKDYALNYSKVVERQIMIKQKRFSEVISNIDESLTIMEDISSAPRLDTAQMILLKTELLQESGEWEAAEVHFDLVIDVFQRYGSFYWLAVACFLASTRLLNDSAYKRTDRLETALKLCRKYNLAHLLLREDNFLQLLPYALKEGICTFYIHRLANEHSTIRDLLDTHGKKEVSAVEKAVPLCIQTFGEFKIRRGSQDAPEIIWKTSKTRNLFKYLLVNRNQPVHQEVLVDVFWPGEKLESGIRKLYTAIAFLRRSLEPDLVRYRQSAYVFRKDKSYLLSIPAKSVVDSDRFEQYIKKSRFEIMEGRLEDAYENYVQACKLYSGPYMNENLYDDWAEAPRKQYEMQIIELGLRIAEEFFERKNYEKALELTQKLQNSDPLMEDAVVLKMKIHIAQNRSSLAVKIYQSYSELLQRELELTPGDYPRMLYESLSIGP